MESVATCDIDVVDRGLRLKRARQVGSGGAAALGLGGMELAARRVMNTAAGFTGRRLARHAEEHGLPRGTVSSWLGWSRDDLEGPRRIPISRLYAAWAALARALDDPAVGVRAALGWEVADFELFGFCVATAPTAGAAVRTAVRYMALVTDSGEWRMEEGTDPVRLTWTRSGPLTPGRAISNEAAVASFAVAFRELTAAPPLAVDLRHPAPRRWSDHRDLLGCPVGFASQRDGLLIARKDLDRVPRQANPALWHFLTRLADEELVRVRPRSAHALVERALADALDAGGDGVPSVGSVARLMGLSERTLRRRLRDERRSFRELMDEVRRARASELLADPKKSMTEVALAAGFADVSAFGHAWRRWFGVSPSSSRRSAR